MKQSRYFPLGFSGDHDQQWKIPVCLLLGNADGSSKTCLLLTEEEQHFELAQSCLDWIIPNADSAGEGIELCVAKVQQHQAEMDAWLGQ